MPIKPEEALEIVGIDPTKYESADALKEEFESAWVKKDQAKNDPDVRKSVLGKTFDTGRHKLKKFAEEAGIEVEGADFKNGDLLDLIPKVNEAVKVKLGEVEEWKKKAEKAVPDDVLKENEKRLKLLEKERDTFKSQAVEFQDKYTALETEVKTSKAKQAEASEWNAALGGINFHQGVDDLKRKGFIATAKEKYRLQFGDDGKATLTDANGNPMKHPKKAGELLTLAEALKMDAKELKLEAVNPHANKPVAQERKVLRFGEGSGEGSGPKKKEVYIAPRMI